MLNRLRFLLGSWPLYPYKIDAEGRICSNQSDVSLWQLKLRRMIAQVIPHFQYGACIICRLPWYVSTGHSIRYSENSGCFAVCETCWSGLGPRTCLPYYEKHLRKYHKPEEVPEMIDFMEREVYGDGLFRISMAEIPIPD